MSPTMAQKEVNLSNYAIAKSRSMSAPSGTNNAMHEDAANFF
jgi:hypothetical protein